MWHFTHYAQVNLQGNRLGVEGGKAFAEAIRVGRSLTQVHVLSATLSATLSFVSLRHLLAVYRLTSLAMRSVGFPGMIAIE
jgi:hypothetical protein